MRLGRYALLVLAVFACSTAVLMIKASALHPSVIAAGRLLLASALLTPAMLAAWRRSGRPAPRHVLGRAAPGALLLALHFLTWAAGAQMTAAANASLIVNLAPVAMPFLLLALAGERVNRMEVVGSGVALSGVALLTAPALRLGTSIAGDALCFGSMLLFAGYLAVSKVRRSELPLWVYVVPLYWMAGLVCSGFALAMAPRTLEFPLREWLLLAGLAVIPTIVGHSLLQYCMSHLRGQTVSIVNLGQFVFAGAIAFVLFDERPAGAFYLAAALVVAGAVTVIRGAPRPAARVVASEVEPA